MTTARFDPTNSFFRSVGRKDQAFVGTRRIILTILGVLAFWPSADAQRAVEVSPPVLLHHGQLGGQVDSAFTVANPTGESVRVRVYLSDWHYLPDGSPNYLDAGSLPRSLAPFITFNPSEMLLEPGASAEVRYTVDLASDVEPGSYWGVLFMEAEDPDPQPGFELARFDVRIGHVAYVNVEPIEPSGMIGGIFGEPPANPQDAYTLAIQYVNTGNAVQRVDGYVELRNEAGEVLFHEIMPAIVSLPGDAVGRTFDIFGPLEPGNYTALVVYNYGDETTDVAADYSFTLDQALIEPETSDAPQAENAETTDEAAGGSGEPDVTVEGARE